jgi:hypothetical protein
MNETSGRTLRDTAGAPQNGTLHGEQPDLGDPGVPASQAPFGAGTSADLHESRDQYIAVAHDAAFEVPAGTIQLWFRADDADEKQALFAKDRDGRGAGQLLIWLDDRDLKVKLESASSDHTIIANNVVSSNSWYQLTFTFGPAGMKLYLNGTLVGSNAHTGGLTANTQAIVIGGSNAGNKYSGSDLSRLQVRDAFDGNIDEVAFFGTALTPAEIAQTRQRGPMAVVAPQDVDDTLVSIERTLYTGGAVPAIQQAMFSDSALANVATFFGLHGCVDLGFFDGRGPAEQRPSGWASALKQGLDFIKQKVRSHADSAGAGHQAQAGAMELPGWVVLGTSEQDGKDARKKDAQADAKADVKVDWKSALTGFIPLLSKGQGGGRAPNITEFKAPAPKDKGGPG